MPANKIVEALSDLLQLELIRKIDYHFAKSILTHCTNDCGETKALVTFLSALLSAELSKGNICINIPKYNFSRPFGVKEEETLEFFGALPEKEFWSELLAKSNVVSTNEQTPLIYSDNRIYINRYWHFEKNVAQLWLGTNITQEGHSDVKEILQELFPRPYNFLSQRLNKLSLDQASDMKSRVEACIDILDITEPNTIQWPLVDKVLSTHTQQSDLNELDNIIDDKFRLDWQKVAVASSLARKRCIISGGPGTGKTTTVVKLLAALIMQQEKKLEPDLVITLVAPTGKAAARLTESIGGALQTMPLDKSVKDKVPTSASTLHRLLGAVKGASKFRFNKQNRLHVDILVVDEASMVDLPMMAAVLCALPDHARLYLLGDKDQLSSVEAGSVLGDICSFAKYGYSKKHADTLCSSTEFQISGKKQKQNVSDDICVLQKSYRFHSKSGVGQLSKAINKGDAKAAIDVFSDNYSDIKMHELSTSTYVKLITDIGDEYSRFLDAIEQGDAAKFIISKFNEVRLLCAIREGDFGTIGLNGKIEAELTSRGKITPAKYSVWYEGRPIMVTRNDYSTGLFNGDVGITMMCPEDQNLKVFFELPTGEIRGFQTCRIPEHETVFAMTIHKSQGSEFKKTFIILPTVASPIVTRELIYTGVTRAKGSLELFANTKILQSGIKRKTIRHSGLSAQLWQLNMQNDT